ncbi:hypothetical protein Pla52o_24150 [Novipirellula galeiformis]|uniref:Ferric reductase like transmembrane component n=1 Tax=Novipirellula galeiformis TaxID=2528004 RepID=A0A5C6CDE8_9BACT|nr:hypothetical protein [Novipirellula galeiformis]TWU22883.1 hypothetical protein Pla52o_24150 [Novipirellula galeiformis]
MKPIHFRTRRWIGITVTLIAAAIVMIVNQWQHNRLGHASHFTGFTLLATLCLLILLGVRRRLPVLPLGNVSTWTQIHLYTGLFATVVYVAHVPALIAGGQFECTLSLMFLIVTASGFYGLYASRTLPRRLSAVNGEYRYDQIPWHRNEIAKAANRLLDGTSNEPAMTALKTFYRKYLTPFFDSSPTLAYVVAPTGHRRRRLLSELKELDRYLESQSRSTAGQFAALVRRRDDLDYQYALQLRLRLWVILHSIFSLLLFAGAIIHAAVALRFTS